MALILSQYGDVDICVPSYLGSQNVPKAPSIWEIVQSKEDSSAEITIVIEPSHSKIFLLQRIFPKKCMAVWRVHGFERPISYILVGPVHTGNRAGPRVWSSFNVHWRAYLEIWGWALANRWLQKQYCCIIGQCREYHTARSPVREIRELEEAIIFLHAF